MILTFLLHPVAIKSLELVLFSIAFLIAKLFSISSFLEFFISKKSSIYLPQFYLNSIQIFVLSSLFVKMILFVPVSIAILQFLFESMIQSLPRVPMLRSFSIHVPPMENIADNNIWLTLASILPLLRHLEELNLAGSCLGSSLETEVSFSWKAFCQSFKELKSLIRFDMSSIAL